jgi:hypothetical protein
VLGVAAKKPSGGFLIGAAILRRVGRLEERYESELSGKPKQRLRVVVTFAGGEFANLATSTCQRYLGGGFLHELVKLDGDDDHLSDEDLEKFIEIPITVSASETAG